MNCFPITLTLEDERKKRNRLIKRKSRYRKLLRMAKPDVALNSGLRDFPLDDALEQASHAYFDMLPLEMNAATEPEKALNSEVLACNSPVNSFLSGWPLGSGNHKEIINTSDSGFAKELQLWTTEVNQVNFDNLLSKETG
ncbi:hypothetical protein ACCO45_000312 [Purpureocillium lilacinum]|uniref:Uncharacterized protein n=1 Tax=Purpureocillium lilacinum TaxID=33203 RepID=A0ACC4E715_PURLI